MTAVANAAVNLIIRSTDRKTDLWKKCAFVDLYRIRSGINSIFLRKYSRMFRQGKLQHIIHAYRQILRHRRWLTSGPGASPINMPIDCLF